MKSARAYAVVFVTAPDVRTARMLAQGVLKMRLAACVNLVPQIESHYWWQGKLERSTETLLVIKTRHKSLEVLEQAILKLHPYDTPEIIALPIKMGTSRYLDWISASLLR